MTMEFELFIIVYYSGLAAGMLIIRQLGKNPNSRFGKYDWVPG